MTIDCGPRNPSNQAAPDPRVVFEVLSHEIQEEGRTIKLAEYSAVPSIAHHVLVEQSEYPVHVYSRVRTGDFIIKPQEIRGLDGTFGLPAIGISMSVAEIYEGLDFTWRQTLMLYHQRETPGEAEPGAKRSTQCPSLPALTILLLQTAVAATNLKSSESPKERSVAYGMVTAR